MVSTALGCMGGSNETFPGSSILLGGGMTIPPSPKAAAQPAAFVQGMILSCPPGIGVHTLRALLIPQVPAGPRLA